MYTGNIPYAWVVFLACSNIMVALVHSEKQKVSTDPGMTANLLKPLCSHLENLQNVTIVDTGSFHSPHYFYEYHVKPGVPVIFRNVGMNMPNLRDWNSDRYLSETFGTDVVSVESTKKENRTSPVLKINLKEFLWRYKSEELYMVHHVSDKMKEALPLMKPLLCGGFQKMLIDPVLWLSSGGTKSVLHRDEFHNLNCLLDGTKDLVLIDKIHRQDVEKHGFVDRGHYSLVDVDGVDLARFPELGSVPCYKFTLNAGDCVFIPVRWYHQVRSHGPRNMAFNIWFAHLLKFDTDDCGHDLDLPEFDSLRKYEFTGHLEQMRVTILEDFQMLERVLFNDCQTFWEKKLPDRADIRKLFNQIDSNQDGILSWTELYAFDVLDVARKFPQLFAPGNQELDEVEREETLVSELQLELPKEEL